MHRCNFHKRENQYEPQRESPKKQDRHDDGDEEDDDVT
jgi:hypothetical protein